MSSSFPVTCPCMLENFGQVKKLKSFVECGWLCHHLTQSHWGVDLKKYPDISLATWVYSGTKGIAVQYMQSNGEPCTSPEKQQRGIHFYELGRDCCKQVYWRKMKVPSTVIFHWQSYGSFPLAELLLGKKESFCPPDQVVNWNHFLSEILLVSEVCVKWHIHENSVF